MKGDPVRIQWLDVLRGLAILLVLLFHFTVRYVDKYPQNAFQDTLPFVVTFGWVGVHLFFMISGFIIYLTIQKKNGPSDFLIARLSRLLPPYWCAIVLIVFLEYAHSALFHVENRNNIADAFVNIIMVPDVFKRRFLDGAFWSLFVEIKFYLLFAVLWKLVDMKNHRTFYISYGILLGGATFHNIAYSLPYGENLNYFLIFWTGVAACKTLYEKMPVWIYGIITILTSVSILGLEPGGPTLLIGIPIFAGLFLASSKLYTAYPRTEKFFLPLAKLGRISYSFYLIHQPIGYLVLGAAASIGVNHLLGVALACSACYGVAWLGFRFIEQLNKPIAEFISGKTGHRWLKVGGYS